MTTPAEDEVIAKAKIGERAILTPEIDQKIPASLIRALLLGTPPPGHTAPIPLPGQVLRISGAHIIEGPLDLADCTGPGGAPLPGLALENCVFDEDMDLSHAHLAKLSLQGSAIHGVTMHGIQLQAGLDCSNTRAQTKNGPAWIDAHAAKIQGGVNADGAKLRANTRPGKKEDWQLSYYALRLSDAVIAGSLTFQNKFAATGGINISNARITGDVWGSNATLIAGEQDAFFAQNTQIRGTVGLDDLKATGCLWMLGVTIGGTLSIPNARLHNYKVDGSGVALNAQSATIGGAVLLRDNFTAEGQVSLLGAKINGVLDCNNATICNATATQSAITLNAANAEIGQDINLTSFTSIGVVSFWGCRAGGDFDCTNATLAAWGPNELCYALDGRNLTIGRDADLSGTQIIGRLVLEHAQIGGTLTWGKGDLWNGIFYQKNPLRFPSYLPIKLPDLKKGKLYWRGKTLTRHGFARRPYKNPLNRNVLRDSPHARLILAHAKIGAALQAYHLTTQVPLLIDLSAVQAYTLDDDFSQGDKESPKPAFPAGWGSQKTQLDLDGFTYQRIEHFPVAPAKPPGFSQKCLSLFATFMRTITKLWPFSKHQQHIHDWCAEFENPKDTHTPRLKWLERQHQKPGQEDAFYPQPYRHLATVLRSLGHREAARKIAIAEGHASASGLLAPLYKLFWGYLFGFGLLPLRAFGVMLLTIAIGWGMVKWADHNQVLTLTPDRVEAYAIEHPLPPNQTNILKCGPSEIWPSFYALDMAIPLIPLHQEDRCEVNPKPGTWAWQLLWAAYSIIAKIITSLALITISGVMKPKDE